MEYYVFANPVWQWEFYSSAKWGKTLVLEAMILKRLWLMMMNSTLLIHCVNLNDHPKWIHLFFILLHSGLARINQLKPIGLLPQFHQLICLLTQGGKTQPRFGKDNWIKSIPYFTKSGIQWIMQLPALLQFFSGFY